MKIMEFQKSGLMTLALIAVCCGADDPWPTPTLRWIDFNMERPVIGLNAATGANYTIQSSTNLVAWKDLDSVYLYVSPALWTNPVSVTAPCGFYRAMVSTPASATNPSPANLTAGVSTTAVLSWIAGAGANSYDVYFGTTPPGAFMGHQTAATFAPGTLSHNTTYYWRVDEKNGGETTPGTVWSFTTAMRPAGATYVGAGSVASGTGPITPALPSGLVPGDLLMLFLETAGDNIAVANADGILNPANNGGTWLAVARGVASPQAIGSGTDEVHLTAYYSRYNGTQGDPTTSDSGDHQLGRIVAFRGVVADGVPWDVVDGTTEAKNDTSGYAPGSITTVSNTLVVGAVAAALPDANGTNNFSGWTNSIIGMTGLTERVDDSTSAGNGGALGVATAGFAPAGVSYGRMNVTLANASYKAALSVALKPEVPPKQITNAWPAHSATNIGVQADLRWTAGSGAATRDICFGTSSPPPFQVSQTATTFDPGTLSPNTTYYWRVDEKNAVGTTPGVVRSFTTGAAGIVPQLAGMTLSNATEELVSAGCSVGTITNQYSDTVPAGMVLSQNPAGGSACLPGTVVDLIRSRGPEAGVVVFPNGPDFLEGKAIPVHRCVSLATTHAGTLLAFTEHRTNGAADEDDMDIVLRRSTDGGETWGPVIVVADDGMNPCKNQVPVVLPSGRILMLWLWNAWIPSEADRTTREVYVTYSDDDGLTWAPHTNITSQVYQAGWNWYGMGPGHAFVKTRAPHAGRVIFPSRHGVDGAPGTSHIIYSDDNGNTFQLGGELTEGNESMACEQSDGDILFTARGGPIPDYRYMGISSDGGATFPIQYVDYGLKGSGRCQASLVEHSINLVTGKANILFSNPDDLALRVNGTIKLSENDGDLGTWVKEFRYSDPAPAFSGYSDIAVINAAGDAGIIWEFGSHYDKPQRWDGGVKFRAIPFSAINQPIN
jgi:sialidase-1